MSKTIRTPVTDLLGIKYPIILAGMNKAAGPKLAAAVSNNGGLGVIGGVGFTPRILKLQLKVLKKNLDRPGLPFGVDLLLPQVGGSARKTNYDYNKGHLDELIEIIIKSGAKLFVSAVGVPPVQVVDKLHDARILVMNMVGAPKHVPKALKVGVDLICCQGSEGGGHTGSIATSVLLPRCVDLCKGHNSSLTGRPIYVVAAGGIYDGRGLAMALSYGAQAVWVGTRFVMSEESGASLSHKQDILKAKASSTKTTLVYTGRPLRLIPNAYTKHWETKQSKLHDGLLKNGIIPALYDQKNKDLSRFLPFHLTGQVAGCIEDIKPAKLIILEMMAEAIKIFEDMPSRISKL